MLSASVGPSDSSFLPQRYHRQFSTILNGKDRSAVFRMARNANANALRVSLGHKLLHQQLSVSPGKSQVQRSAVLRLKMLPGRNRTLRTSGKPTDCLAMVKLNWKDKLVRSSPACTTLLSQRRQSLLARQS